MSRFDCIDFILDVLLSAKVRVNFLRHSFAPLHELGVPTGNVGLMLVIRCLNWLVKSFKPLVFWKGYFELDPRVLKLLCDNLFEILYPLLKILLPHPLKTMEDQMNHRVGKIGVDLGAILEVTLNNNNFSHAHHLNKILEDKIKEEEAITIKNIILVFEIHEINVYFATSKIYLLP